MFILFFVLILLISNPSVINVEPSPDAESTGLPNSHELLVELYFNVCPLAAGSNPNSTESPVSETWNFEDVLVLIRFTVFPSVIKE